MRARSILLAVALLLISARVTAEPAPIPQEVDAPLFLRMRKPSTLSRDGVTLRELPPGYFLDDEAYARLDAEVRRLQDVETRLKAENRALRATVNEWQPGWKSLIGAVVVGVAWGFWTHSKLDR